MKSLYLFIQPSQSWILSPVIRMPSTLLLQGGCLSHGGCLLLSGDKGGPQISYLVSQVPLVQNNQYTKVACFWVTYSELLYWFMLNSLLQGGALTDFTWPTFKLCWWDFGSNLHSVTIFSQLLTQWIETWTWCFYKLKRNLRLILLSIMPSYSWPTYL